MKCNCLSEKERIFLYKCVLRHHKEHGSYVEFMKSKIFSKDKFLKCVYNKEVHDYLIGAVWAVYLRHINHDDTADYRYVLSSLFFIELIDLIYDSKYAIFKRISAEIASNEFNFISNTIEEIDYENKTLLKNIKSRINKAWDNYGFLSSDQNNIHNIPID